MNADEWSRVRDLFEEVWELPATEREALLERSCAGDQELREQVEELLAAEATEARGALPGDPPAAARAVLGIGNDALEGTRVGQFLLIREVARGGMGTVYEAEQDNPHRRVALKVMNLALTSGDASRRFQLEVEVLGRLRHPGIAQVHGAGVHEVGGRELPWFAMELVVGALPLNRFVAERGLSLAERIELVLSICEAVHHGHQRGVVHRDLKPDNLLVDAAGAVKVIDFGVAYATDADVEQTRVTRAGEIVGTLHYMSPEQVAGDRDELDVRSDVYALGVVLYELIAGRLPHDLTDTSLPEAARIVCDERPRPPSAVVRGLDVDLDTIVLKAIDKEPDRRYPSALALASDLRHFLAHEPIEARPPSAAYELKLFARRNRAAVAGGALAVAALVAGIIVSTGFAFDARRSAEDAHAVKTNLVDFSLQLVNELDRQIQTMEGSTEVRAAMVRATVERLDWLAEREDGDPEVGAALSRAYLQLGGLLGNSRSFNLGDPEGGRECYEKAFAIASALFVEDPSDANAILRSTAEASLGDAARDRGAYGEAEELYSGALAVLSSLEQPDTQEVLGARARLHAGIGTMRGATDDDLGAAAEFARALELRRAQAEAGPGEDADFTLAEAHGKVSIALAQLGRLEEALEHSAEEARLLEELEARHPDNVVHRMARAEAGITTVDLLRKLGRHTEGRRAAEASADVFDALVEVDPANSYPRVRLSILCLLAGQNELDAAESASASAANEPLVEARGWIQRGLAALAELEAGGGAPAWIEQLEENLREELERVEEQLGES